MPESFSFDPLGRGMDMYYDRCLNEIDMGRWMDLRRDRDYVVIGVDEVSGWVVSTVWLGLNHNVFGPPLIFETMMYTVDPYLQDYGPFGMDLGPNWDDYQQRYTTESQARAGHQELVRTLRRAEFELGHMGKELVTRGRT
jgi:hypothetical protein